jgi:hypothetical protein
MIFRSFRMMEAEKSYLERSTNREKFPVELKGVGGFR